MMATNPKRYVNVIYCSQNSDKDIFLYKIRNKKIKNVQKKKARSEKKKKYFESTH